MTELYVFCEGPTEQGFCAQVLFPNLFTSAEGVGRTILAANSKRRGVVSRGGIGKYSALRRDISNQLRARREQTVFFTTMIDLYGLPNDFPGKADNTRNAVNPTPYVEALEEAFRVDISDERFTPHLQLHEYETLLFANPDSMTPWFDNCKGAVKGMKAIASKVASIEQIDDGENTSPSKRIIRLLPEYAGRKATFGPQIAERIGMRVLREKCPHFDAWVSRLERLLAVL